MSGPASRPALLLLALALVAAGLLACGGGAETTHSDVATDTTQGPIPSVPGTRQALNTALRTFNPHCLAPAAQRRSGAYPIRLFNPSLDAPSFKYRELQALVQAGLLDTTVAEGARGLPVHEFRLTSAGRDAQYEIAQTRTYTPMFCYAVPRVVRLDSIKAVYNSGPNALANVWFSYSYQNLGEWRRSRLIRRSFSGLPPLPAPSDTLRTRQLLVRVDSAWIDRRLTGYGRPPDRSTP